MQIRRHTREGAVRALVLAACAGLALTGCQAAHAGQTLAAGQGAAGAPAATATPAAKVTITPDAGSTDVRPDTPVHVYAAGGKLTEVTLTAADGRVVPGAIDAAGTWANQAPLAVDTAYTVAAAAVDHNGLVTRATSSLHTLKPASTMTAVLTPDGITVGVGMPVIVDFSSPVKNRDAVVQRLSVQTTPQLDGAWRWLSNKQVQWRPQSFYPAGTRGTITANLAGVEAATGVWGAKNYTASFAIGSAMVSTVDVAAHTMTVTKDGQVLRVIPVTTGKDGEGGKYETRNGIKVVMARTTLQHMDAASTGTDKSSPDYYNVDVKWAMRLTWSGEFIHAAPWSVASQGHANVSHGCTGMSDADAQWLFSISKVGDVVRYVNSPRQPDWGNGYTLWNVSFDTWKSGGAA